jgi:hypothetical protein
VWGDSGIQDRPHLVTAAPFLTSIANDGARRIHPTREADRYFEIGAPFVRVAGDWTQIQLGAPERSANLLTWTRQNANLYITHGGHFLKLGILLKNGWTPEGGQFAFPLALQGLTRDGGQLLADGQPVMRVRRPIVYDYDNPFDRREMAHQFTQLAGQWYVLFTLPDLAGMSRPLVDPTLDLQPDSSGEDTFLASNATTTNYGTDTSIDVRGAGSITRRFCLRFDLSSIDGADTCDSANLYLYAQAPPAPDSTCNNAVHLMLGNNRNWTEGSATWATYDGSNSWIGSAGCSTSGTDYNATACGTWSVESTVSDGDEFNISLDTSQVEGEFGGDIDFVGLQSTGDNYNLFYSSDHSTAAERPNLVVVYTEAGGAIYDDDLTLSQVKGLTATADVTAEAAASLARIMGDVQAGEVQAAAFFDLLKVLGITPTGAASAEGSTTLDVIRQLTSAAQADATGQASLDMVRSVLESAIAGADAQTSLRQTRAFTAAATLAGIDVAVTLSKTQGIDATVQAQANTFLSELRTMGLTAVATASGQAVLDLVRTHTIDITSAAGSVIDAAVTLSRTVGLTATADVDASAVVDLLRAQGYSASATVIANASTTLDLARALAIVADEGVVVSVDLERVQSVAQDSNLDAAVLITLDEVRDTTIAAQVQAEGTLSLDESRAMEIVSDAIAEAGLALRVIGTIEAASTKGIIVVAAESTFVVPPQDRTFEVPAEDRTFVVPPSDRDLEA